MFYLAMPRHPAQQESPADVCAAEVRVWWDQVDLDWVLPLAVDQFRRLGTFGLNSTKKNGRLKGLRTPSTLEAGIRRRVGLVQDHLRRATIFAGELDDLSPLLGLPSDEMAERHSSERAALLLGALGEPSTSIALPSTLLGEAPMMRPMWSFTGDIVSDKSIRVPSLRRLMVS